MRLIPPDAYYEPYLVNTITSQKTQRCVFDRTYLENKNTDYKHTNSQHRPFSSQLPGGFLCVKNINVYVIMCI